MITKYAVRSVMAISNNGESRIRRMELLKDLTGSIIAVIQSDKLKLLWQVIEVKILGQPHIVYVDVDGYKQTILARIGSKLTNISEV